MNLITIDFETYWDSTGYTLSKISAVDYIRDKRFYAQMLGVAIDRGPVTVYEHDEIPDALKELALDRPDRIVVGHNSAGFDNLILSEIYGVHPAIMTDTIHLMRWTGVSRLVRESLSSMTDWFGTGHKRTGTVISDKKRTKADFTEYEWKDFKAYCAEDVQQTRDCAYKMLAYIPRAALAFSNITCHMATDPKFIVNRDVLDAYVQELKAKEQAAYNEVKKIFNFASDEQFIKYVRSATKFASLLKLLGVEPPMKFSAKQTETLQKKISAQLADPNLSEPARRLLEIQYDTCEVYTPALAKTDLEFIALRDHPDPRVQLLVNARLEHNSSIAMNRAQALIRMASYHKPLPVMLKAFYAHTSRYGAGLSEGKSDSLNLQNIPKHRKDMKPLRQSIRAPRGYKVVACDSSQIEARVLAYAAQQTDLLQQFIDRRDPYAEMASKFDTPLTAQQIHDGAKAGDPVAKMLRQIGKKSVLSCYAADTEVLTDNGWKRIVDVAPDDNLWDGEKWTSHGGVICNGKRQTIELDGVRVTPEHMIMTPSGWLTARECTYKLGNLESTLCFGTANLPDSVMIAQLDSNASMSRIAIPGRDAGESMQQTIQLAKLRLLYASQTLPTTRVEPLDYAERLQKQEEKWWRAKPVPVYDILDCGDLHRFTVKTAHGVMLTHNCGYGVGMQKFSDTLLREGTRLDPDNDKHKELAKKYHAIYRQSVPAIVQFWNTCQAVISALVVGQSGTFGGPDGTLFKYGAMTVCGKVDVPSIQLPTGYILRYPNLRAEYSSANKLEYFYDRPMGNNLVKTKLYGGALTENCIAAGTPVLTQYGLKPIEAVTESDLIFDGIRYVRHAGVVSKGVQTCINVNGCWVTPDHLIMEHGEWRHGSETQRPDRVKIWKADRIAPVIHRQMRVGVGMRVRVWQPRQAKRAVAYEVCPRWPHAHVYRLLQRSSLQPLAQARAVSNTQNKRRTTLQRNWHPDNDIILPDRTRLARGQAGVPNEPRQRQVEVFDIMNCGPRHRFVIFGKYPMLAHNCIQSLAFQILMMQAVAIYSQGINIVTNVHDSFATIVPAEDAHDTLETMLLCMHIVPPWVEGLPLAAEGEIGEDFTIV